MEDLKLDIDELVDSDAITPAEAGFLEGELAACEGEEADDIE